MQRTNSFIVNGERYPFDFDLCSAAKGWAQIDTKQDASYYGTWANPLTLEFVNYCEGDVTHIRYDDAAEFTAGILETVQWNKDSGYWKGIDGMCRPEIIDAFTRLGLAEYLH
jgi:hypothetical protein